MKLFIVTGISGVLHRGRGTAEVGWKVVRAFQSGAGLAVPEHWVNRMPGALKVSVFHPNGPFSKWEAYLVSFQLRGDVSNGRKNWGVEGRVNPHAEF